MVEYYHCFSCSKILPILGDAEKKCLFCENTNGEILSQERVVTGLEAGTYLTIDPATGKRAKKSKRSVR